MRDDRARLLDILEAIEKIEQRASAGKEQFLADELLQVWMIHYILIIGEASSRLSESLRERSATIPWDDVIAMGNILVHQYFGIDLEEVWGTVSFDIPTLRSAIEKILEGPG